MVQLTKNQLHTVTITGYTAEGLRSEERRVGKEC